MKFIYYSPSEYNESPILKSIEAQNKEEAIAKWNTLYGFGTIEYVYTLEEFWDLI
jgi:hypothetical protein